MSDHPIKELVDDRTFEQLGICEELVTACQRLNYVQPTKIQQESIPYGLLKKDIIGLASTGSGKTAAFAIPILQALLESPEPNFALILTPTRELALQISDQFKALGAFIGLKTAVLVGGLDLMEQAIQLAQKPHIIVGTPGRVVDHLQNTKGFSIQKLKFLVLDEADRLLNMDFEKEINLIVANSPKDRTTFLFSATMTNQVQKLQRACLKRDAVKVEVSTKYSTVDTLTQEYLFIPSQYKETYCVYLLQQFMGSSVIIFCDTASNATKLTLILEKLNFKAVAMFGKLSQYKRLEALNKFKSKGRNILVATDVASRGLDIPYVDLVINFDIPQQSKNYIHRVGRTARAGRAGRAISLITQYDVQLFQRIEALMKIRMSEYATEQDQVLLLQEKVNEASRRSQKELSNNVDIDQEDLLDQDGFNIKPEQKKRQRTDMSKKAQKKRSLKKKLRRN